MFQILISIAAFLGTIGAMLAVLLIAGSKSFRDDEESFNFYVGAASMLTVFALAFAAAAFTFWWAA